MIAAAWIIVARVVTQLASQIPAKVRVSELNPNVGVDALRSLCSAELLFKPRILARRPPAEQVVLGPSRASGVERWRGSVQTFF